MNTAVFRVAFGFLQNALLLPDTARIKAVRDYTDSGFYNTLSMEVAVESPDFDGIGHDGKRLECSPTYRQAEDGTISFIGWGIPGKA